MIDLQKSSRGRRSKWQNIVVNWKRTYLCVWVPFPTLFLLFRVEGSSLRSETAAVLADIVAVTRAGFNPLILAEQAACLQDSSL